MIILKILYQASNLTLKLYSTQHNVNINISPSYFMIQKQNTEHNLSFEAQQKITIIQSELSERMVGRAGTVGETWSFPGVGDGLGEFVWD